MTTTRNPRTRQPSPAQEEDAKLRKVSEEDLKQILAAHKSWLETGGENGKQADLTQTDLRDAYLQGANLRYANLQKAKLINVNLQGASLSRPLTEDEQESMGGAPECVLLAVDFPGLRRSGSSP